MKDVIVLFAKVSAVAFLSCVGLVFAFSVGYKNGFWHGKADCVPTDYGRLEYAPASGGWVAVGCKEAAR